MSVAILLIAGMALMVLLDRAIWRQIFIFLSIEAQIDGWTSGEDGERYRYADPVKLILLALFTGSVLLIVNSARWLPEGLGLLFVAGFGYLYYTFKSARAAFESISIARTDRDITQQH